MRTLTLPLALLLTVPALFGQQKSATPLTPASKPTAQHSTWAVVVGISDYQDPDIPDLRFADKDAEAFAQFLRSPGGGALDGDHLKVLTNQQATAGRIAEALDGLIEQAKEGDQIIIYFSGHGDVEGKKISQPGFLLCWDAPSRVYMGGGTYSLSFLQEVVTTLSVQNKAKVIVITDACHAGKLAGSQIGGAQLTTANMAKQFANEVKILSCQPNEFSLEGEQWGGGRGVFSYHLVDGLLGLADRNGDGQVSLGEMDRYLEDKVTAEAAPQSQVPMLLGNKTERLAVVNTAVLADLQKLKSGQMAIFAPTEGRGFEEEVLSRVDSSIREQFFAFKKAVAEKRFFEPEKDCADWFYASLSQNESLAPLHSFMKKNFAVALQDDAQQVVNKYLRSDLQEIGLSVQAKREKYNVYPRRLNRAAELLGENHYLYCELRARAAYFEGFVFAYLSGFNYETGRKAVAQFREALHWHPDMPLYSLGMSWCYGNLLYEADSAELYTHRANELAPMWVMPFVRMGEAFSTSFQQYDKARQYFEMAEQIDSTAAIVLEGWANFYFDQKNYAEAERYLNRLLADPDATVCMSCARSLLGTTYLETGRFAQAEEVFRNLIAYDPTYSDARISLGKVLARTGRTTEAEAEIRKGAELLGPPSSPDLGTFNY